jgi:hypothetical protein
VALGPGGKVVQWAERLELPQEAVWNCGKNHRLRIQQTARSAYRALSLAEAAARGL